MKFAGAIPEGPKRVPPSSACRSLYWYNLAQQRKPLAECISLSLHLAGPGEVFSAASPLLASSSHIVLDVTCWVFEKSGARPEMSLALWPKSHSIKSEFPICVSHP